MRVLMCDKNDNFLFSPCPGGISPKGMFNFLLHQLTSIKVNGSLIKGNLGGGGGGAEAISFGQQTPPTPNRKHPKLQH